MQSPVTFQMDYPQVRISRDRVQTMIQGVFTSEDGTNTKDGWSKVYTDGNCWVDPITKTLMLRPAPLLAAWATTTSGIYARMGVADFSFPAPNDSSKWKNVDNGVAGNTFITETGSSTVQNEKFISTALWGDNTPVYLSGFTYNPSNEKTAVLAFGFGTSLVAGVLNGETVSFALYNDGTVNVNYQGSTYTSGSVASADKSDNDPQQDVNPNTFQDIMVLFLREREVLVYSPTSGGGFSFVAGWIDEGTAAPVINGASTYLCVQVSSGKPMVQVSKFGFPTSGYQCGILSRLLVDPPNAGATCSVYQDSILGNGGATASLRDSTNSGAYASGKDCRIKASLTGDGTDTPYVFGALAAWETEAAATYDATFDLNAWILASDVPVLNVPDSFENESLSFSLKLKSVDGTTIEDSGLDRPKDIAFRPVRLIRSSDSMVLFEGVSMPPRWTDSAVEEGEILQFECRSLWYLLEQYMFHDDLPLDGYNLQTAFETVLGICGITTYNVSTSTFTIPSIPSKDGDWNCKIEVGDTGADAIRMILDAYCADWYIRETPGVSGVVFEILSQADLGTTSITELYRDNATAVLGGVATADIPFKVFWSYDQTPISPEANDLFLMGFDPRTKRAIWSHAENVDMKNPTLAPADRPLGWRGFPSKYGYQEPRLTTETAVNNAMPILEKNLLTPKVACEFTASTQESDLSRPLWKGDTARLRETVSAALSTIADARMLGIHIGFHVENSSYIYRDCQYTAQHITADNPNPAMLRVTGGTIGDIEAEVNRRAVTSYKPTGRVAHIIGGPPAIAVDYP